MTDYREHMAQLAELDRLRVENAELRRDLGLKRQRREPPWPAQQLMPSLNEQQYAGLCQHNRFGMYCGSIHGGLFEPLAWLGS